MTIKTTVGRVAQSGAALWILNVWFNRFDKDTGYRGGDATNMKEEFQEYGLPENAMYAVGATKVGLAVTLLVGLFVPKVTRPAAVGLAAFMVGALGMHAKVGDPLKRSAPALTVLTLSIIAAVFAENALTRKAKVAAALTAAQAVANR